jgi:hypothetical protein
VQSVGRILRAKHAFANPIIYDIKDNHDVFRKQWFKRKAYYKQQNYNIVECDSYNYNKELFTDVLSKDDVEDNIEDDDETDKNTGGICFLKMKK